MVWTGGLFEQTTNQVLKEPGEFRDQIIVTQFDYQVTLPVLDLCKYGFSVLDDDGPCPLQFHQTGLVDRGSLSLRQ